jgi:hypothetical protein
MSADISFRLANEEAIAYNFLRLSDVGLSDTAPVYETPTFRKSVGRLPRRWKPWRNQEMWDGNLASHLWFRATVIVERVATRIAMLRRPSLF